MGFIGRSIIWKLALHLFLLLLVIVGVFGYFHYFRDLKNLPVHYYGVAFLIFLFYFVSLYFWDVVRPLKKVLFQMQALLTGKPYKRIFTKRVDEIGIVAHFFNQVTKGLGKVSYDIKDRERMLDELDLAAELQKEILPLTSPSIKGLQVVAKNKPATEIGGDSFNYFEIGDKVYIYLGDVTGHGVSGGLVMSMVNSLINVFTEIYDSPYEIMVNVNKYIKRHVKRAMFMTMVLLCWNQKTQKMTYVGAGHEHILVYRAGSGQCEAILTGGVALGMVPDNSKVISEKVLNLDLGDFLVLYTDGITEAKNIKGEFFGLDSLKTLVVEYAPEYSAEGINYHIAKEVTAFMGSEMQHDDMTLITIKHDGSEKEEADIKDKSTKWRI